MVAAYWAERGQHRRIWGRRQADNTFCAGSAAVCAALVISALAVGLLIYSPFSARLNVLLLGLLAAPPVLAFALEVAHNEPPPANQEYLDQANQAAMRNCCALDGVFVLIFILLMQVLILNFSPAERRVNLLCAFMLFVPPGCAWAWKQDTLPTYRFEQESYFEIPDAFKELESDELLRKSYSEDL